MTDIDLIKTDRVNSLDVMLNNINVSITDNHTSLTNDLNALDSELTTKIDNNYNTLDNKIDTNTESLRTLINTINSTLTTTINDVLQKKVYPVNSLYITLNNTNPSSVLGFGTWTQVGSGRVLQGADSTHTAGSTINAGLPNITGQINTNGTYGFDTFTSSSGAFSNSTNQQKWRASTINSTISGASYQLNFSAKNCNSIYGASTTVQPPAYCVIIWRRTA